MKEERSKPKNASRRRSSTRGAKERVRSEGEAYI
jgi:hypothetical protein